MEIEIIRKLNEEYRSFLLDQFMIAQRLFNDLSRHLDMHIRWKYQSHELPSTSDHHV